MDPFKNRAISLFLYNLGEIKSATDHQVLREKLRCRTYEDAKVVETLPVTSFGKIFKSHFGNVKTSENHNDIIRDNYKIYYYDNGEETCFTELMVAGKQAIVEILKLGSIHNWAVMSPGRNKLDHLDSMQEYGYLNLDEYFSDDK